MSLKIARRVVQFVAGAAVVVLALALLWSSAPSQAAPQAKKNVKLSGDMQPSGDVDNYLLSPDSRYVVYRADAETDDAYELYSAATTGLAEPQRLSGLLAAGTAVGRYDITPDSERVVYIAPQDTAGVYELYVVDIGGGQTTRLNDALPAGGDVADFVISPDGQRVVYRADQDTDDVMELHSVPITGGETTPLNDTLIDGDVIAFALSPDSQWAVYVADQDTDEVYELYSVPITGGDVEKLNGPLVDGGDVETDSYLHYLFVGFGGGRVVYLADQLSDGYPELFSVPITGGQAIRLNNPLTNFRNVERFLVSPDGQQVVYQIESGLYSLDIYSVPIAGGEEPDIINRDDPGIITHFAVSPDSQRVVYIANTTPFDNSNWRLYGAPIAGEGDVELNDPFPAVNNTVDGAVISPDSLHVFYRADQQTPGVVELYRVPITGGDVAKLNGPMVTGGDILQFALSPDGERVVYIGDQQSDEVMELYNVPAGGGMPAKLNNALVAGGDVLSFLISADSGRVVYWADEETDEQLELFAAYDDSLLTPTPTPTATPTITPTATGTTAPTATPTTPANQTPGALPPRAYIPMTVDD